VRDKFEIDFRSKYGYDIIDIRGEITIDNFEKIESFIKKNITGENSIAIINLEFVSFINSSALASLIKIKDELSILNVQVYVMNANAMVQGIFSATGMMKYFKFIKDETILMNRKKDAELDEFLNDVDSADELE
jgi:anti-anti-sigma factor